MVRVLMHVVLFKFKAEVDAGQVDAALQALRRMKGEIPFIVEMAVGAQDSNIHVGYEDWSKGYTHGMTVTLANGEDLREFRDHPMHKRFVAKFLMPIVDDMLAFDCYDTTEPVRPRRRGGPLTLGNLVSGTLALAVGAVLGASRSKAPAPR